MAHNFKKKPVSPTDMMVHTFVNKILALIIIMAHKIILIIDWTTHWNYDPQFNDIK